MKHNLDMSSKIASVSKKQAASNRKLKKVYEEIANERGHYCTGCGKSSVDVPLSHSHLIPRSRRKDLETDKRNITYHCSSSVDYNGKSRKGRHDMWESTQRVKLLDYHKNMETILELDVEYYYLISGIGEKI